MTQACSSYVLNSLKNDQKLFWRSIYIVVKFWKLEYNSLIFFSEIYLSRWAKFNTFFCSWNFLWIIWVHATKLEKHIWHNFWNFYLEFRNCLPILFFLKYPKSVLFLMLMQQCFTINHNELDKISIFDLKKFCQFK